MTIEGATINGSAVTDAENYTDGYPRKGTFTVHEQAGNRSMTLDLMGHKSHQYLIVDNTMPLRRSLHGDHYESIGSVYLGMTQADLEAAYGQADSSADDQGTARLIFSSHHMDVYLQAGIVIGIRIYEGSDLKFDKSGLGVSDTAAAYAKLIAGKRHRRCRPMLRQFLKHINFRKANTCGLDRISYSFPFNDV